MYNNIIIERKTMDNTTEEFLDEQYQILRQQILDDLLELYFLKSNQDVYMHNYKEWRKGATPIEQQLQADLDDNERFSQLITLDDLSVVVKQHAKNALDLQPLEHQQQKQQLAQTQQEVIESPPEDSCAHTTLTSGQNASVVTNSNTTATTGDAGSLSANQQIQSPKSQSQSELLSSQHRPLSPSTRQQHAAASTQLDTAATIQQKQLNSQTQQSIETDLSKLPDSTSSKPSSLSDSLKDQLTSQQDSVKTNDKESQPTKQHTSSAATPKSPVHTVLAQSSQSIVTPQQQIASTRRLAASQVTQTPISAVTPPTSKAPQTSIQQTLTAQSFISTHHTHQITPSGYSTRQHSISSACDSAIGSQQKQIAERALHEANITAKVAELRKKGLWSQRRLPKVQEPSRPKTHWDYLLEEMAWLSTDFVNERRWKKNAAKKCAKMVNKYHLDKRLQKERAERMHIQHLKRLASQMAKEVRIFWSSIEKVVDFRQQTKLEERRKKALDLHLKFIVDQTEKYSSEVQKDLAKSLQVVTNTPVNSCNVSENGRMENSPTTPAPITDTIDSNKELLNQSESNGSAEKRPHDANDETSSEKVSLDVDEIGDSKLNDETNSLEPSTKRIKLESQDEEELQADSLDEEFQADSLDEEDDESTIQKEEELCSDLNHKEELKDLEDEADLPIEELLKKYGGAYEDCPTSLNVSSVEDGSSNGEETISEDSNDKTVDKEDDTASDNDGQETTSTTPVGDFDKESIDDGEATEDEEYADDQEYADDEEEEEVGNSDHDSDMTDVGLEYLIDPEKDNGEKESVINVSFFIHLFLSALNAPHSCLTRRLEGFTEGLY